jgi:hypothetical protein
MIENKSWLELLQLIIFVLNWKKRIEARCFLRQTLTQFWVAPLQQKAVDVLSQFGTTFLCKSGFSSAETVS